MTELEEKLQKIEKLLKELGELDSKQTWKERERDGALPEITAIEKQLIELGVMEENGSFKYIRKPTEDEKVIQDKIAEITDIYY